MEQQQTINVILTGYKRDHLDEMIQRIHAQTLRPTEIYLWQNESHVDFTPVLKKYPEVRHIHSKNTNFKFHGRFTLPLLFDPHKIRYTAIFDDDTMPNRSWLKHAVKWCEELDSPIGANARNIYEGGGGLCDGKFSDHPVRYDVIGHCWVFRTEWIHCMFRDPAYTFDNGEDIQFCATQQIYGGRNVYLAPQSRNDPDTWADTKWYYGNDVHRTCNTPNFVKFRREIAEHWIQKGWKPCPNQRMMENHLPL